MDTIDHMRDLVLAAAYLAYRRTGSYREAAHLIGTPVSSADIQSWLMRGAVPTDHKVYEVYPSVRAFLQGEMDLVTRRFDEFLQPPEAITTAPPDEAAP